MLIASATDTRASASSRFAVFAVAAAVRLLLSAAFYGSVDKTNDILNAGAIFDGHGLYLRLPYFPGIHLLLRIGGLLILHTGIPPTLAFKLFPSLFDAGIAALLMDFGSSARDGRRRAWLYAFAPIPLIITCIHGQWEPLFLFFLLLAVWAWRLQSTGGDLIAGAAYVLSIIAKPVAAPLLFFFLPKLRAVHDPNERRHGSIAVGSMLTTVVAYLAIIRVVGMPLTVHRLRWIMDYANVGIQLIGLPELIPIPLPRVLGLLALAPLLWLFWTGRIGRERAVFLFFLAMIGYCGISPQYLLWVVPFAFAVGEIRFAILYNVLGAVALFCYYVSPGTTGLNIENFGALAPLARLGWLSPPRLSAGLTTGAVVIVANLLIPLASLAAFAIGVIRAARVPLIERHALPAPRQVLTVTAVLVATIVLATLGSAAAATIPGNEFVHFALRRAVSEYAVMLYSGRGLVHPDEPALIARSLATPVATSPFNVFVLGLVGSAVWAVAAVAVEVRRA